MTHTTICESEATKSKYIHFKFNHYQMTHTTICESKEIKSKRNPLLNLIIANQLTQPSVS